MKNTFAVILSCGLASVLEAHIIGYRRYYEGGPEERNYDGVFYQKRQTIGIYPASTVPLLTSPQLVSHLHPHPLAQDPFNAQITGYYAPAFPYTHYLPQVHYFTFSQAQHPAYQVAPVQPVQNDAAPSPDMGGTARILTTDYDYDVDAPKVADTVDLDLRTDEPTPPLVEEQSDERGDEATLSLDYLD